MLRNSEGKRVPQVTFRTRQDGQWKDVTTSQLFDGRTVVLFSLPGAYTPTCSSTHVPRYNELAATFRKAGVDDIVCISVNDGFVMSEWQKDQNAPNLTFI
ncbi:MAG TPA: redoxin family protein, partial [Usitatibacter sp.]